MAAASIAVAQYTRDVAAEGALQAGEHAAAAVEAGSGDVEVTVLGDDAPALVIDGTTGFYCQIALALQAAFGVVEAGGIQGQASVAAENQTVRTVLHRTTGSEGQQFVGCNSTAIAVVETAGQQVQKSLAGQLAALVVDLIGAGNHQRAETGQLAVGIGQGAEQIKGDRAIASQAAGAVVQVRTGKTDALLSIDGGIGVVEEGGLDTQTGTAVDQATLTVIQCPGNDEGLRTATG